MANNIVPFGAALAQELFDREGQFVVDFDLAWQWLGYTRKNNARKKLEINFSEGIDYCSKWSNQPSTNASGFVAVEEIMLTIDCFKMLGMIAQTDQGKQVREYFLDCERRLKARESGSSLPPTKAKLLELGYELEMLRKRTKRQQNLLNPDQNQS